MGVGFSLVLLAWMSFSLAMPKHQQTVLPHALPPRAAPWLKIMSWCLLAAGLAACVAEKGASQGAIFWGALLILAALAWVLLMTCAPRRSVLTAAVVALVCSALALL